MKKILLLLLFAATAYTCLAQQGESDKDNVFKKKYYIKPGQKLYTKDTRFVKGIAAYNKHAVINTGGQQVDTVETGDYESRTVNGVAQPNGDYMVYKTITKGTGAAAETTYDVAKKEIAKTNKIKLEVTLAFDEKKVTVKMARGIRDTSSKDIPDPYRGSADTINSADNKASFYWKLEPGETFTYQRSAFTFGALSLPFKIRFGKESEGIPSTIETGLSNIGAYFGRRWSSIKYKNNSFRTFHATLAIFAGPQKITINKDNSKGVVTEEISRLGITSGLMLSFSSGDFTIGIGPGIDFLSGKYKNDWVYNKKVWVGFAVGYKVVLL